MPESRRPRPAAQSTALPTLGAALAAAAAQGCEAPACGDTRADEVRAYCETDVVNTWLVYCRFRFLRGEIDRTAYEAEIALVRDTLTASDAPHWKEYMAAWDAN